MLFTQFNMDDALEVGYEEGTEEGKISATLKSAADNNGTFSFPYTKSSLIGVKKSTKIPASRHSQP